MKITNEPALELADIFRQFGHQLGQLSVGQRKVVEAIVNCRTSIMGGRKLNCSNDQCDFEKHVYNSCRNRFCPKCQFLARAKWIEKRSEELLPCQYFHVVFTLPSELKPLLLANQKVCYNLLFKAAAETLQEVAANPKNLGAEIGFIGILHTWAQNLTFHPHVHFLVPGGGLNEDKNKWTPCKQDYMLPVKVLSRVFRGKLLGFFEKAFHQEELRFSGQIEFLSTFAHFKDLLLTCASKDFVVDSRKPFAGPSQIINYLGHYTHRIAISNYRLVSLDGEFVRFKVRDKEKPQTSKVMTLHVKEFMRRFLLHIVPKRFVRIRHFGLLGNRLKKMNIQIIRKLEGIVQQVAQSLSENWQDLLKRATGIDVNRCPKCGKGELDETTVGMTLNSS